MKLDYIYYKMIRGILRLVFPRAKTTYEIAPGDEPAVFVCNHAAVRGPVMMTLDFKRPHQTWTVSFALDSKKAKSYAFHDILMGESRRHKGFYRFLSRIIARMLPPLLHYSDTIPVYHDRGIVTTFKQSVQALNDGDDLVIFAESAARYSPYVCRLQEGFVDLARLYYKRTKKRLRFYPVYVEKKNAAITVGAPIAYDPDEPMESQRQRITAYLCENIDRLARGLPPHRPVPFLPERWYDAYGRFEHDFGAYWQMIREETDDDST